MVREFQRVIGQEARAQILEEEGRLPDAVIACVGGGSNAMGAFADFIEDEAVRLIGVEAAGKGLDSAEHGATLLRGRPGVLHGAETRSEEHTSELQSLMRISYAVFCLKKKNKYEQKD